MNNDPSSLGTVMTETLLSEPVLSLTSDYAEIGLDAIISDGIFKEIPFAKSLVALAKVGLAISDRLLINKLLLFLAGLDGVPLAKRREMVSRLECDPIFGQKVGEHVMELLSRIDGRQKPKIVAKIFAAYSNNQIDAKSLLRLNFAVERLPAAEIINVRPFCNRSKDAPFHFDSYTAQSLANSGLAEVESGAGGLFFMPTELCRTFLYLALDELEVK